MTSWQCTNLDDNRRCPYDAYYHGRCYQHRRDAPNPERPYPLPRHSCSGCGYPEPLQHIPPWRDMAPQRPSRIGLYGRLSGAA